MVICVESFDHLGSVHSHWSLVCQIGLVRPILAWLIIHVLVVEQMQDIGLSLIGLPLAGKTWFISVLSLKGFPLINKPIYYHILLVGLL